MGVWREFWNRSFPVGPITRSVSGPRSVERGVIDRQAQLLREADARIARLSAQLDEATLASTDARVEALRTMLADERGRTERAVTLAEEWQKQCETLLGVVRNITRAMTSDA